ncbi:MAG: YjfK family protein [Oleiphilaceae bacterium]|nr:YjfK family protein [Oleiphilaceae bacterium]
MFKKWFGKTPDAKPIAAPEVMGLRLGGAFELDALKLKLIEPHLVVQGVARTQLIQAVGEVKLDENTTVLRFYTDDEGYLQVLLSGGMTEQHVADVKLWYFYETKGIASSRDWENQLQNVISTPQKRFEGHDYMRVWGDNDMLSPPVAMTEVTYSEGGAVSETDQFAMLYQRHATDSLNEYLMLVGEEKIIMNTADRCVVTSTGFDIQPADIEIIG